MRSDHDRLGCVSISVVGSKLHNTTVSCKSNTSQSHSRQSQYSLGTRNVRWNFLQSELNETNAHMSIQYFLWNLPVSSLSYLCESLPAIIRHSGACMLQAWRWNYCWSKQVTRSLLECYNLHRVQQTEGELISTLHDMQSRTYWASAVVQSIKYADSHSCMIMNDEL